MRKFTLLFLVTVILCSCIHPRGSWQKDISHCKILENYVGSSLKLQRDAGVIKEQYVPHYRVADLNNPLYERAKERKADNNTKSYISVLEKGTVLTIDSFRIERIYAGPIIIVAVGKITIPGKEEMQAFEYIWSDTWELGRTPWDDDSVPEKRILRLDEKCRCID